VQRNEKYVKRQSFRKSSETFNHTVQ